MSEKQSINYSYDINLLKRTVNRIWKHAIIGPALLLIACITMIIVAKNNLFVVGFFCGIIYLLILLLILKYKQQKRNTINLLKILTTKATVTEQGYMTNSQATYVWSDIKTIYRYPDSWLIILKYRAFIIIPLENMPQDMQTELLENAQAAGCKVK